MVGRLPEHGERRHGDYEAHRGAHHRPFGGVCVVRAPRCKLYLDQVLAKKQSLEAEAWAMFIADKVEPHKVARWSALQAVLDAALGEDGGARSLERAALVYLDLRQDEAVREGLPVHPMATLTRNHLLRTLG